MLYKPTNSRYYFAKWKFHGQVIRRSTRETSRKRAQTAEIRLRTDFNEEQAKIIKVADQFGCDAAEISKAAQRWGCEAVEIAKAVKRFSCDATELARCPECGRLFNSHRAAIGADEKKLCGDHCRAAWDQRCNPVPTLSAFLQRDFFPFAEARAATKPNTQQYYRFGVTCLLHSELAKLRLDEITSQHATGYAATHTKYSPSTINCVLRTLRHALNLAVEWGKLTRAPKIRLTKGERQRERVVTDAEFAAYIELCAQPWHDVALLIRGEGMCPGECYKLRWEHVLLDGKRGLIQIAEGKTKARRRVLPMVPEVYAALLNRRMAQGTPTRGWVFPAESRSGHLEQGSAKNYHARALKLLLAASDAYERAKHTEDLGTDWTQALAERVGLGRDFMVRHADAIQIGIRWFEPYCLRHTALTRFAESGCDAFTLAKIAGHSSITITQRYCHPQAEAIERAFQKVAAPKQLLRS